MKLVKVATCNLAQWALDFDGNLKRIIASIKEAKRLGAAFRLGPELEIPGYGCEDHFFEQDTLDHSWECLAEILKDDLTDGILCDIGMPVQHHGVGYNCRVFCLNRQIILIRPKLFLADDGNYREPRWFTSWKRRFQTEPLELPSVITAVTGQKTTVFGEAALQCREIAIATETCEELFTPNSPHIPLYLDGVDIIANGSGSHHQLRKLDTRVNLMRSATSKLGGCYLYANQQGCDGGRLYFDGSAMIVCNGGVLAQGSQFSLNDIEVVTATINIDEIRSYRRAIASRGVQASESTPVPRISVDFHMCREVFLPGVRASQPKPVKYLCPEEEIAYGPACWMWDYLRRSGLCGFFLPLSGGADSSATAALVGSMCQLVVKEAKEGNQSVIQDARRIAGEPEDSTYVPTDPKEYANRIFHTCYMGTDNSSEETRKRARDLAAEVGSYHLDTNIESIVDSYSALFTEATGMTPKYKVFGGSNAENLALQNIQSRTRMVWSYFLARLLLWTRGRQGAGLIVLGSANVDEALRGYFTKYDCSSADINPIGSISKTDLKKFLSWASENLGYPSLRSVVAAVPTAELEPHTASHTQTDEDDMGMSYSELSAYGRLRKIFNLGPVGMFKHLAHEWGHLPVRTVADKVKKFFHYYAINRHKMTTLTPSYHAESYSPDDNRFDLRQFLYNARFPWQFRKIDESVAEFESAQSSKTSTIV